MSADLPRTIAEAARLIETRALSPVDIVRALTERIETFDPVISSFLTMTADEALAQARHAESEIAKGKYRGALHGIPFGAKDNFETRGIRTTGHSRAYAHHVPYAKRFIASSFSKRRGRGTSPPVFGGVNWASRRAHSAMASFHGKLACVALAGVFIIRAPVSGLHPLTLQL